MLYTVADHIITRDNGLNTNIPPSIPPPFLPPSPHHEKFIKFDGSILVQINFTYHVPYLVSRDALAECLQYISYFRARNVTILIRIELEIKMIIIIHHYLY